MTFVAKSVSYTILNDEGDDLGDKGKKFITFVQIRLLNKKVPKCLVQLYVLHPR